MDDNNTQQSIWNFDGAELFLIFQIKSSIVEALESWDLDKAYWKCRLLRQELDAKLKRGNKKIIDEFNKSIGKKKEKSEKSKVDEKMRLLDSAYSKYCKINDPYEKEKSEFYQKVEAFYMDLCYIMKQHGLYYREGEDSTLAVLRR